MRPKLRTFLYLSIVGTCLIATTSLANRCFEEESFDVECISICDQVEGVWQCVHDPFWADRCCIEYIPYPACGEAIATTESCPQCVPGGCGF